MGDCGGGSKGRGSYEAAMVLHGCPAHDDDDDPEVDEAWEMMWSDDEADDAHAICPGALRVKDFNSRPEWLALSEQGLTEKPVVKGCFFAYHKASRAWQASYPDVPSMSCTHGGVTGRSPEFALLEVVARLLQTHCEKFKKDKVWARQLTRVVTARDSMAS